MLSIDIHRLLSLFERGVVTEGEFVIRLVEAAAEGTPPVEIAAVIPPATLHQIRGKAAAPRDTNWLICRVGTYLGTPKQLATAQEREERLWLDGLERWREYFGFPG